MFLLDKQGRIRWMHVGEGDYGDAEQLIQKLLAEKETSSEDKNIPSHGLQFAARPMLASLDTNWPHGQLKSLRHASLSC